MRTGFVLFLSIVSITSFSQVEVDQKVVLTGSSGNRSIEQLVTPVNGTDAANKDYVDSAVSASGGGANLSMISAESSSAMNYGDALRYCNGLSESSHSDWRMPTWQEVQTVVSTGGVVVPNPVSATYFWVQPHGFTHSGGDYYTIRWFRLSDGYYSGTWGTSTSTRNVRCVR